MSIVFVRIVVFNADHHPGFWTDCLQMVLYIPLELC